MVTLRNYKPEDYSAVVDILKQANMFADTWESEENLLGMIKKDPESIVLAIDNKKVIGNLFIISFGTKVFHLYRLVVAKDYRNQGIASQILKYVEELAKKRGVIELVLFVDKHNQRLQEYYKKRGFVTSDKPYVAMWKVLE